MNNATGNPALLTRRQQLKEQSIGATEIRLEKIIEVAFHLNAQGDCCIDVAVSGDHEQPQHEVIQFGSNSDGATAYARTLMDETWSCGWVFAEERHYRNGTSWCHVPASTRVDDIEKQRSWLYLFMPNLNVHSIIDERHLDYPSCETTAMEVTR